MAMQPALDALRSALEQLEPALQPLAQALQPIATPIATALEPTLVALDPYAAQLVAFEPSLALGSDDARAALYLVATLGLTILVTFICIVRCIFRACTPKPRFEDQLPYARLKEIDVEKAAAASAASAEAAAAKKKSSADKAVEDATRYKAAAAAKLAATAALRAAQLDATESSGSEEALAALAAAQERLEAEEAAEKQAHARLLAASKKRALGEAELPENPHAGHEAIKEAIPTFNRIPVPVIEDLDKYSKGVTPAKSIVPMLLPTGMKAPSGGANEAYNCSTPRYVLAAPSNRTPRSWRSWLVNITFGRGSKYENRKPDEVIPGANQYPLAAQLLEAGLGGTGQVSYRKSVEGAADPKPWTSATEAAAAKAAKQAQKRATEKRSIAMYMRQKAAEPAL